MARDEITIELAQERIDFGCDVVGFDPEVEVKLQASGSPPRQGLEPPAIDPFHGAMRAASQVK